MLTRVGDFAHHTRTTQLLLDAQSRARETQVQIGSGKAAERFRDVAADVNRLVDTKDILERTRQFQVNNQVVDGRLEAMDSSLTSLFDLGTRLRVLLIQRLDSGAAVPGAISPEVEQMLEQTVAELNVDYNGRHLFSGSRTDTPPVALDPAFSAFGSPDTTYYQGDAVELTVRADIDREVSYGMTADQSGFQDLIGALRATLEGDGSSDTALLESALDLVNGALPKISDYQSEIGARQASLERINAGLGDAEVYLQHRISEVEDVDLAEAVTRLSQDQMVVESSMATMARLSQLSLADFLR